MNHKGGDGGRSVPPQIEFGWKFTPRFQRSEEYEIRDMNQQIPGNSDILSDKCVSKVFYARR